MTSRIQFLLLVFSFFSSASFLSALQASAVLENPQTLQVAYDVDVIVAGGSTYAVAAAEEAAKNGASVFLLTDRPYLGEDLCMTMRYALDPKFQQDDLLKAIWQGKTLTSPLTIKRQLDLVLLKNKVHFLTGSYPQELVTDEKGRFAGITMISRSGRHFIRGKMLIDATDQSVLARQSQLPFSEISSDPITFKFRVTGGKPVLSEEVKATTLDVQVPIRTHSGKKFKEKKASIVEYTYKRKLERGDWSEIMRVEHRLRTLCHQRDMAECSERMDYHLGMKLEGRSAMKSWPGASQVDLAHFSHEDYPRYVVLGKYASITPEAAKDMLQIQEMVTLARRLGKSAAQQVKTLKNIDGKTLAHVTQKSPKSNALVRTASRDIRSGFNAGTYQLNETDLPILGEYDVVVVGGGTSGAPAMLGAAEQGAKTLLVEYLDELGGVGTAGMIAKYWYGLRNGYTARVDKATKAGSQGWNAVTKSEWLRQTILQAGGEVWLRSYGCGALVEGNKVKGIVVATPFGRGAILAKTVIDSTGNADMPVHAGAASRYSIDKKGIFSVQMAGYPLRNFGQSQNNTCYALVDDSDALDVWHLMMTTRHQQKGKFFDAGQLLDSRERRRIVGDYTLTTQDILTGRKFPDTLLQMKSNFDAAAFPNSPMLLVKDMKGPVFTCDMPYRCFLPQGFDGVLAIGLGASAERDAMTLVRMQPDLQNQGYAVGIAAALAAKQDGDTRGINMKSLQKLVIRHGILSAKSYGQKDSFPLPEKEIIAAVKEVAGMSRELGWDKNTSMKSIRKAWKASREKEVPVYISLAKIVSHPKIAIPALKAHLAQSQSKLEQINVACVLAILGDESGKEVLLREVSQSPWDSGFGVTSHRETHNTYTSMDRMVIALGMCSGDEVRSVLKRKLETLTADTELSHLLAISLALKDRWGADLKEPLLKLLATPGFTGYVQRYGQTYASDEVKKALLVRKNTNTKTNNDLNRALKELMVAGMLYSAGDHEGRGGKILKAYADEVSGQLSRYAKHLLARRYNM